MNGTSRATCSGIGTLFFLTTKESASRLDGRVVVLRCEVFSCDVIDGSCWRFVSCGAQSLPHET